jgi:hypothetical protein
LDVVSLDFGGGELEQGSVESAPAEYPTIPLHGTRRHPSAPGSCAAQGAIAYALLEVVANSAGQATATSTVGEDYGLARTGWYVNVHSSPDLSETEYAPSVSCGDLPPG